MVTGTQTDLVYQIGIGGISMKLKEKLAHSHAQNNCHPASDESRAWFEVGYLAGFEKARELAFKLHSSKRVNDCFTDSDEFLQMGEEEV